MSYKKKPKYSGTYGFVKRKQSYYKKQGRKTRITHSRASPYASPETKDYKLWVK